MLVVQQPGSQCSGVCRESCCTIGTGRGSVRSSAGMRGGCCCLVTSSSGTRFGGAGACSDTLSRFEKSGPVCTFSGISCFSMLSSWSQMSSPCTVSSLADLYNNSSFVPLFWAVPKLILNHDLVPHLKWLLLLGANAQLFMADLGAWASSHHSAPSFHFVLRSSVFMIGDCFGVPGRKSRSCQPMSNCAGDSLVYFGVARGHVPGWLCLCLEVVVLLRLQISLLTGWHEGTQLKIFFV